MIPLPSLGPPGSSWEGAVGKYRGEGLGHTGGTLDRWSVPVSLLIFLSNNDRAVKNYEDWSGKQGQ